VGAMCEYWERELRGERLVVSPAYQWDENRRRFLTICLAEGKAQGHVAGSPPVSAVVIGESEDTCQLLL